MPRYENLIEKQEKLLEDENYRKYWEEKQLIKSKYPPIIFEYTSAGRPGRPGKENKKRFIKEDHIEYKKYIKELLDLMFTPNGNFQKFVWDNMSEGDKIKQERKAQGGRKKYTKIEDE